MMKQNIAPFIRPQRLKQLLTRVILMMHLNQSIVQLYQTYKKHTVKEHTINNWKYKPSSGSIYIKLPKELDHPKKILINVQNINDIEYLNGVWSDIYILKIIIQIDIKFPVKIRNIHKSQNKNSIAISVFGYENKRKYSFYEPKKCFE